MSKNITKPETAQIVWIKELWNFAKNPKQVFIQSKQKEGVWKHFSDLFILTSWGLIFASLANFVVAGVLKIADFSREDNFILAQSFDSMSIWEIILAGVILIPLVEEMYFRFFMSKIRWEILVGLFFIFYILGGFVFNFFSFDNQTDNYIEFGLLILWAYLLFLYHTFFPKDFLFKNFTKYFNYWFWSSSALFGLVHIGNYDNLGYLYLLAPIIVLPQFLAGIIFSFARIRFNLLSAWFVHGLYNLLNLWLFLALGKSFQNIQDFIDKNLRFVDLTSQEQVYITTVLLIWFGIIFIVLKTAILDVLSSKNKTI